MRRLINKHPDGLAGFKGDMTPSESLKAQPDLETGVRDPKNHPDVPDTHLESQLDSQYGFKPCEIGA